MTWYVVFGEISGCVEGFVGLGFARRASCRYKALEEYIWELLRLKTGQVSAQGMIGYMHKRFVRQKDRPGMMMKKEGYNWQVKGYWAKWWK